MPTVASFTIRGISPYSQSKPHLEELLPGESNDDYRSRTWRAHLHTDGNGSVIIPPSAIKNCLSDAATFMSIKIPGSGKATYTKHVQAGVAVIAPIYLGIRMEDVKSEMLFLPSDGKPGGGRRVWKQYPIIHKWEGEAEVVVLDETVLQTSQRSGNSILQDILEASGQYIGLGRFRPRKNGWYGRFVVENFKLDKR